MVFCCIALVGIAIIYFCLLWLRQLFTWPKPDKKFRHLPGPPRALTGNQPLPVYGHTALFMDKAGDMATLFDPNQREVMWFPQNWSFCGLNRKLGECFACFIWGQWRVVVKGPEQAKRLLESQEMQESWPWTPPVTLLGRSCFGFLSAEERLALQRLIGRSLSPKQVQMYGPIFGQYAEKCLDGITTGRFQKKFLKRLAKKQRQKERQSRRRSSMFASIGGGHHHHHHHPRHYSMGMGLDHSTNSSISGRGRARERGRSLSPTPSRGSSRLSRRHSHAGSSRDRSRSRSHSLSSHNSSIGEEDDDDDDDDDFVDFLSGADDDDDSDEGTFARGPSGERLYKVKWSALRSYTFDLIDGPVLNLNQWVNKRHNNGGGASVLGDDTEEDDIEDVTPPMESSPSGDSVGGDGDVEQQLPSAGPKEKPKQSKQEQKKENTAAANAAADAKKKKRKKGEMPEDRSLMLLWMERMKNGIDVIKTTFGPEWMYIWMLNEYGRALNARMHLEAIFLQHVTRIAGQVPNISHLPGHMTRDVTTQPIPLWAIHENRLAQQEGILGDARVAPQFSTLPGAGVKHNRRRSMSAPHVNYSSDDEPGIVSPIFDLPPQLQDGGSGAASGSGGAAAVVGTSQQEQELYQQQAQEYANALKQLDLVIPVSADSENEEAVELTRMPAPATRSRTETAPSHLTIAAAAGKGIKGGSDHLTNTPRTSNSTMAGLSRSSHQSDHQADQSSRSIRQTESEPRNPYGAEIHSEEFVLGATSAPFHVHRPPPSATVAAGSLKQVLDKTSPPRPAAEQKSLYSQLAEGRGKFGSSDSQDEEEGHEVEGPPEHHRTSNASSSLDGGVSFGAAGGSLDGDGDDDDGSTAFFTATKPESLGSLTTRGSFKSGSPAATAAAAKEPSPPLFQMTTTVITTATSGNNDAASEEFGTPPLSIVGSSLPSTTGGGAAGGGETGSVDNASFLSLESSSLTGGGNSVVQKAKSAEHEVVFSSSSVKSSGTTTSAENQRFQALIMSLSSSNHSGVEMAPAPDNKHDKTTVDSVFRNSHHSAAGASAGDGASVHSHHTGGTGDGGGVASLADDAADVLSTTSTLQMLEEVDEQNDQAGAEDDDDDDLMLGDSLDGSDSFGYGGTTELTQHASLRVDQQSGAVEMQHPFESHASASAQDLEGRPSLVAVQSAATFQRTNVTSSSRRVVGDSSSAWMAAGESTAATSSTVGSTPPPTPPVSSTTAASSSSPFNPRHSSSAVGKSKGPILMPQTTDHSSSSPLMPPTGGSRPIMPVLERIMRQHDLAGNGISLTVATELSLLLWMTMDIGNAWTAMALSLLSTDKEACTLVQEELDVLELQHSISSENSSQGTPFGFGIGNSSHHHGSSINNNHHHNSHSFMYSAAVLNQTKYLDALISEAIRLCPSNLGGMKKTTETVEMHGVQIPAGTNVFFCQPTDLKFDIRGAVGKKPEHFGRRYPCVELHGFLPLHGLEVPLMVLQTKVFLIALLHKFTPSLSVKQTFIRRVGAKVRHSLHALKSVTSVSQQLQQLQHHRSRSMNHLNSSAHEHGERQSEFSMHSSVNDVGDGASSTGDQFVNVPLNNNNNSKHGPQRTSSSGLPLSPFDDLEANYGAGATDNVTTLSQDHTAKREQQEEEQRTVSQNEAMSMFTKTPFPEPRRVIHLRPRSLD